MTMLYIAFRYYPTQSIAGVCAIALMGWIYWQIFAGLIGQIVIVPSYTCP